MDAVSSVLRETDARIEDAEVLSRMNLSKPEMAILIDNLLSTLFRLRQSLPDPEDIVDWADALDGARTELRRYLGNL